MISVDTKDMPEFFQQKKYRRQIHDVPEAQHASDRVYRPWLYHRKRLGKLSRRTVLYAASNFRMDLKESDKLPEPIYTPSTKAEIGDHDENISFEQSIDHLEKYFPGRGRELAEQLRDNTIALYKKCAEYALSKGIIIADTKFEFGLDENGNMVIGDEMLTPDSSRFWPAEGYEPGHSQPSFDKQFARDWLTAHPG